ncbi:hypothetical protein N9N28_11630 [Rubripirellula amarantea]|nr:hypothetical protein [Rubripirellula amarantea]
MLSRKTLEDEGRYLVRIMPGSKLHLTAPMGDTLFPGEQTLKLEVTNGRRSLSEKSFDFAVAGGDFPALEVSQAYLDNELSVSPAQIGSSDHASRACNLRFSNNSSNQKNVRVELVDLQGNAIDGVRLSSDDFAVRSGRTKTIRAAVNNRKGGGETVFGVVRIHASDESGNGSQVSELPIAILAKEEASSSVKFGELASVQQGGMTSFRFPVTNTGEGYLPVDGRLEIADGSGHALKLADGYGKWLRPGETRELAFSPNRGLPAGKYQLKLHVETKDGIEPFDQTLIVDLGDQS